MIDFSDKTNDYAQNVLKATWDIAERILPSIIKKSNTAPNPAHAKTAWAIAEAFLEYAEDHRLKMLKEMSEND